MAIYDGTEMVGFLVYGRDPADERYWLYRFMIDRRHQGKGHGKAALNVREATGGHVRDYKIPEVDEIFDPSFSPDGRRVVFSAQVGGVTDLFIYDLVAAQLRRLTNDAYADLQPSWSPDGRSIVFSTDRFSTDLQTLRAGNYRLGLIDPSGSDIRALPSFEDAKNIDPSWSADGRSVFFISDRNGISNVYRLDVSSGETAQVTDLLTGASGITGLSPALSVARDRLVYSVYEKGQNRIYAVEGARMAGMALSDAGDRPRAATLPPRERPGQEVAALRREPTFGLPTNQKTVIEEYKPKLSLDYVGQTVAVDGDTAPLKDGKATWLVSVDKPVTATINITNSTGQTVMTSTRSLDAGKNQPLTWDGKDASDLQWPDGNYKISITAKDANGQSVSIPTEIEAMVDSADLTETPPLLSIAGKDYTIDKLKRVIRN